MHHPVNPVNPVQKAVLILSILSSLVHPVQGATPGKRRALLVAISRYQSEGRRGWPKLSADRDAAALRDVLVGRWGFAKDDVRVLQDADATRSGIVRAFEEHLIAPARPGDALVFFFAGHGQQVPDDDGDETDGLDESLVPFDHGGAKAADGARANLRDDTLRRLLARLSERLRPRAPAETPGSVTVIADCCFSGTVTRGILTARGRGWDEKLDGPRPKRRNKQAPPDDLLPAGAEQSGSQLLSASDSTQPAFERLENGYPAGGAFTYYLVRALWAAGEATTYGELHRTVSAQVAGDYPGQDPQLEGRPERRLFSGLAQPAPFYPVVKEPITDETVTLSAGEAHGVARGSRYALLPPGADPARGAGEAAARVQVVRTSPGTATAMLLSGSRFDRDRLLGGSAVLLSAGVSERPLRVLLDGSRYPAAALAGFGALVTKGVSRRDYDVRVVRRRGALVVLRSDDSPLLMGRDRTEKDRVREALLGAWRRRYLARLRQEDPESPVRISLNVRRCDAEGNLLPPGRTGSATAGHLEGSRTGSTTAGHPTYYEGEYVRLELHNPSEVDVFVTVFDLAPDGSIRPLFPHPRRPGEGDQRIPAGKTVVVPSFVFQLTCPLGTDLFKALATRSRVDFSPLIYNPESGRRGVESLPEGPGRALASLLLNATTGRRGNTAESVESAFWGTAEVALDVRARPKR